MPPLLHCFSHCHGPAVRSQLILPLMAALMLTYQPLPSAGDCHFPPSWSGTWFQSGIRHAIKIDGNFITSKGTCLQSDGDKFLMEDRNEHCFRCIVVHEKHENVLQYKETFCDSRESLDSLCSRINGDAPLHSMFRVNASPISCPIRGPLNFSYNRGHGECSVPLSSVDSCSDDNRLMFRYQACPDVHGTESSAEELICLATWREGSTRYLVGRMEHSLATTDEDKFRCFVYSKTKLMYSIAQSGDATCFGLISPTEGPKTMKLFRAIYPPSNCNFPTWATQGHKWHRLDGLKTYVFSRRNDHTFTVQDDIRGVQEVHVRCLETAPIYPVAHINSKHVATFTAHIIMGCTSGYACMRFVKRSIHVIEVQSGALTRNPGEACDSSNFDRHKSEYTTLIISSPERIRCPYKGQYVAPPIAAQMTSVTTHSSLQGRHHAEFGRRPCTDTLIVRVGCASEGDIMEVQDNCMAQPETTAFHCHEAWEENGTGYLIVTRRGTKHRYCFIYAEVDNMVKFTTVKESCKRDIQPGIGGTLSFNVTSQGQCDPDYNTSSSQSVKAVSVHWLIWTSLTLLTVFYSTFNR